MTRMLRSSVAALALIAAPAALAADLPSNAAYEQGYVTPAVYDWTGLYAGASVGYGFGSFGPTDVSGLVGSVHLGFNVQYGTFVVGLEGDGTWSGISDDVAGIERSIDYLGSIRARAGITFDRVLVYGTGGFSFGGFTAANGAVSQSKAGMGWVAGIGAEMAIAQNWTARVEALHYDLGSETYSLPGAVDLGTSTTIIRAGISYKF